MTGAGGPFAGIRDAHTQALVLQGYMMLVAFLALVLGTYRAELRSLVGSVRQEHQWSDRLIAYAPSGLLVVRPEGLVLQANQAVGEILRRDPAHLVGIRGDSLDEGTEPGFATILARAVEADGELVQAEWTARDDASGHRLSLQRPRGARTGRRPRRPRQPRRRLRASAHRAAARARRRARRADRAAEPSPARHPHRLPPPDPPGA